MASEREYVSFLCSRVLQFVAGRMPRFASRATDVAMVALRRFAEHVPQEVRQKQSFRKLFARELKRYSIDCKLGEIDWDESLTKFFKLAQSPSVSGEVDGKLWAYILSIEPQGGIRQFITAPDLPSLAEASFTPHELNAIRSMRAKLQAAFPTITNALANGFHSLSELLAMVGSMSGIEQKYAITALRFYLNTRVQWGELFTKTRDGQIIYGPATPETQEEFKTLREFVDAIRHGKKIPTQEDVGALYSLVLRRVGQESLAQLLETLNATDYQWLAKALVTEMAMRWPLINKVLLVADIPVQLRPIVFNFIAPRLGLLNGGDVIQTLFEAVAETKKAGINVAMAAPTKWLVDRIIQYYKIDRHLGGGWGSTPILGVLETLGNEKVKQLVQRIQADDREFFVANANDKEVKLLRRLFQETKCPSGIPLFSFQEAKELFGNTYEFMSRWTNDGKPRPTATAQTAEEAGLELDAETEYKPPIRLPLMEKESAGVLASLAREVLNQSPVTDNLEEAKRLMGLSSRQSWRLGTEKSAQTIDTQQLEKLLEEDPRIYSAEQILGGKLSLEDLISFVLDNAPTDIVERAKEQLPPDAVKLIGPGVYKQLPENVHLFKDLQKYIGRMPGIKTKDDFHQKLKPFFEREARTITKRAFTNLIDKYIKQTSKGQALSPLSRQQLVDYARAQESTIDFDYLYSTLSDMVGDVETETEAEKVIKSHKYWPAAVLKWIANTSAIKGLQRKPVKVVTIKGLSIYEGDPNYPEVGFVPVIGGGEHRAGHSMPGAAASGSGWLRFRPMLVNEEGKQKKVWMVNENQFDPIQGTRISQETWDDVYSAMYLAMENAIQQAIKNGVDEIWVPPAAYQTARSRRHGDIVAENVDIFGNRGKSVVRVGDKIDEYTPNTAKYEHNYVAPIWQEQYEKLATKVADKMGIPWKYGYIAPIVTLEAVGGYNTVPLVEKAYILDLKPQGQVNEVTGKLHDFMQQFAKLAINNKRLWNEQQRLRIAIAKQNKVGINDVVLRLPRYYGDWPGQHFARIGSKRLAMYQLILTEDGIKIKDPT